MKTFKIIKLIIPGSYRENLIGDLEEEYKIIIKKYGKAKSFFWYIKEVIKSLPYFIILYLVSIKRRIFMDFSKNSSRYAAVGMISIIPALLIVIPGIFFSFLRVESLNKLLNEYVNNTFLVFLVHPLVVFGGLVIAMVLNFFSSVDIKIQSESKSLVSKVSIKGKPINLIVTLISILIIAMLLTYAFVENFIIVEHFH